MPAAQNLSLEEEHQNDRFVKITFDDLWES